ncbi:MAG TPA: alpha/beta fold hydrolase [Verrucomicrobiae bacterium]|nr:alpha/beta fold hydrolase [Verrucomicrobiae bacterium]
MTLNFREQGEGPPLIILHGLFGSLENWAHIAQQLSENFKVFTLDQRNHGSSPHSPDMNFPVLARDVSEFLKEHHIQRAHILGHSLGGKAAMEFALSECANVDRLVVVDMAPRGYPRRHDEIFQALLALRLEAFRTRAEVEQALAGDIPDLAVRRFLLKGLAQDEPGRFRWRFNLPVLFQRYGELTEAVAGGRVCDRPALFIRGGESDYVRHEDLPLIRKFFPHAEIATIESASHWVHAEQPEKFLDQTRKFLCGNF